MSDALAPRSNSEAAAALAGAAAQGRPVRFSGGATKLGWGGPPASDALWLRTGNLARVVAHDSASMVATLGAGTPLVNVQAHLARSGRMLAIDPQLGLGPQPRATVGGVLATADSGPLSHAYGGPTEQVLSVTMALSDGTIIRAPADGARARPPYDLIRLFVGSYGTLGVLLSVDVRLRPLPTQSATAVGGTDNPRLIRDVTVQLARELADLQAFDVAWTAGQGGILAQLAGPDAEARATEVANAMLALGLRNTAVRTDDAALWARQRAGQRSPDRAVLRVQARRSELDHILRLATANEATVVGRAALGLSYLTVNVNQLATVRAALPAQSSAVVLDLPQAARGTVDVWGVDDGPQLDLMRDLKMSFDAALICNPGVFVGRI